MFSNISEIAENIATSAKKILKVPFSSILLLAENNRILQVREKRDGTIVIKVKPKIFGFLPFTTQLKIEVNPNDYINYNKVKESLQKFLGN